MVKNALVLALALGIVFPLAAAAQSSLVRFEGGIGVIPVRAGPAANVVQGVNPGGQPWVISRLSVDVKLDGRVSVDGRGLLLGGGNGIGTNGGQSVLATLFCGAATHHSGTVALEPNGDFRIDDVLTPIPPDPCNSPVLLIRSGGNGNWFAAGIPKP